MMSAMLTLHYYYLYVENIKSDEILWRPLVPGTVLSTEAKGWWKKMPLQKIRLIDIHSEKNAKLNSATHYCHFDFNGKLSHLISSVIHSTAHCLSAYVPRASCFIAPIFTFSVHSSAFHLVSLIFTIFIFITRAFVLGRALFFNGKKNGKRPVKTKVTHI